MVKKQLASQVTGECEKTMDTLLRVAIASIEQVGEAYVRLDDDKIIDGWLLMTNESMNHLLGL